MTTDYDPISEQYQLSKQQPWRAYVECYGLLGLAGNYVGMDIVDLACGEGFYARRLKHGGARRVLGVDSSPGMIDLARKQETQQPFGVEYALSDVREMGHEGEFDLAVAAWLLNYAQTAVELDAMCRAIFNCLKPGGRFVSVNSSPLIDWTSTPPFRKYGFDVKFDGELRLGGPITWTFYLDDESFDIENYYLPRETYEESLKSAGFREVHWHHPQVSDAGLAAYEPGYWETLLSGQPLVFIECMKE